MATVYEWQKTDSGLCATIDLVGVKHCWAEEALWRLSPGSTQMAMKQHQAYQPLLPAGNKYLQQKWDKATYDLHRQHVKTVKATINTTAPKTYSHLDLKLKKQRFHEEWNKKIQRENNLLLGKIAHIMRTTGEVDNMNYCEKKSLNGMQREMELLRITNENQVILRRLTQCKPHYSVKSWHKDWLKTLRVRDSIARYPRGSAKPQKGQEKNTNCQKKVTVEKTNNPHVNKEESEDNDEKKETNKDDTKTDTSPNRNLVLVNPSLEPTGPASDTKPSNPNKQEEQ